MDHPESILDNVTVASPCPADWKAMTGDDQVRFCGQCQLNVYNLSAMTRDEAETLVQSKEGRLCIRYYKRLDGKIMTQDCIVGRQILHQRRLARFGKIAAAVSIITIVGMFTVSQAERPVALAGSPVPPPQHQEWKGEAVMIKPTPSPGATNPTNIKNPPEPVTGVVKLPPPRYEMGDVALPPPKKPCKVPPPKKKDGQ
jgi:hypothetical protein